MAEVSYQEFIHQKSQLDGNFGFSPLWMPDYLFDFQVDLVEWAVKKGRAGIFADCGMGKTIMELVWAQNVYQKTGKPVLILTPLAVAAQFAREAEKFNIEATRSQRGEVKTPIVIINYERLHLLDADQFGGVVCDESSILKSFDGVRRKEITELMRLKPYRLLGTATAAPNDYIELGTSSEALGYLGHMDMLSRFFTNKKRTSHQMKGRWRDSGDGWRFKGHAEQPFWRWVSSWARALRKPADLGYANDGFILPGLNIIRHMVEIGTPPPGMLFNVPAIGWREQRAERKRTIGERCEMAASLVSNTGKPAVVWCAYNAEGDLLEKLIPDAQQVSGRDNNESKEEKLEAFSNGEIRVLVTKPKIGAWGLNWQHCNHLTWFPSYSYEQYYQAVRRCWRFGQENTVTVDIVMTEGERFIQRDLEKKAKAADEMFSALVRHMNDEANIDRLRTYDKEMEVPAWL
jgi:hypothetical protein